jgi:hypothetical protein
MDSVENYLLWILLFFSSRSQAKLLAINHLLISDGTMFETQEISLKFLLEIMTLVSSMNITLSGKVFTHGERLFIVWYEK